MVQILRKICSGVSFSKGRPVLDIFARDVANNRITVQVRGLKCYFYMPSDAHIESDDMKRCVIATYDGYKSIFGQDLKKVVVTKISEINKMGRAYHAFESDIHWDKKMLLDLKITDMFLYDENSGEAITLDKRFYDDDKSINVKTGGVNSSTVLRSRYDKEFIEDTIKLYEDMIKNKNDLFKERICVIDIEVLVKNKDDLRDYIGKIACVVIWDSYTKEYYKFRLEDSEKDMLVMVFQHLKHFDYDVITGWNVNFDLQWLLVRGAWAEINFEIMFPGGKTWVQEYTDPSGVYHKTIHIGGRVVLDLMDLYIKKTITTEKLASYSLKSVANVEGLGEWEDLGPRVNELWDTRADDIVEYCRLDVQRTMEIMYKKDLIGGAFSTCKFFGCQLEEVTTFSKVIEAMMFLLKGNRILPNIVRGREKPDIIGALVLDVKYGLHKNVGIFDAASLYPSIIQGLNVSPECLVQNMNNECVEIDAHKKKVKLLKPEFKSGLMREVIIEMRKLREEIRNKRRKAIEANDQEKIILYTNEEKVAKGVLASVYGVMGFKEFRLFNEDCANTITAIGQVIVSQVRDNLSGKDSEIIYGDTDSVFIKTKDIETAMKLRDDINELIRNKLEKQGIKDQIIDVNFEKFFKWIMFRKRVGVKTKGKLFKKDTGSAKKAYIGYISFIEGKDGNMKETSELYNRGFELRRSDSAIMLKKVMKRFFELMEDGNYGKSIDYLIDVKKGFNDCAIDSIAMPRSVTKEDAKNPWADGMRYAKSVLKFDFHENELPKLVYVKECGKYKKTKVLCYQDHHKIPDDFVIDYDVMFEKLIKAKFEPIIESLGLYWDTAINNQSMLDRFC